MEYKDDFALWTRECVSIRHKTTGRMVAFELNRPQRLVLGRLERQRLSGRPIRLILLKSRQWGASTLITYYLAWIQLFHARNWHSLLCAHTRDVALTFRAMYRQMLDNYPGSPEGMAMTPCEGMGNVKTVACCGARITVASAMSVDAARGADYAMAHLSEVAFWSDTPRRRADDLVRAVCGSIPPVALSVVVMESTGNGTGNFFHREWMRAVAGESDKEAVFVPWYENELCTMPLTCTPAELRESLTDYERGLQAEYGLTDGQMMWYHATARGYNSPESMRAEYPSTPAEAFAAARVNVFSTESLEALRPECADPLYRADVVCGPGSGGDRVCRTPHGRLKVWGEPRGRGHRYICAVDVGGRWEGADWSVISVFDATSPDALELVAEWRGHDDYDRLAYTAAAVGRHWGNALLVVESNSDTSRSLGILERITADGYRNLYQRTVLDSASGRLEAHYGFHTNRATKSAAVADMVELLRDGRYRERNISALEELLAYRRCADGTMAAPQGLHDDLVMTRCIAAYAHRQTRRPARKPFDL